VPNALVAIRLLEELSRRTSLDVSASAIRTAVEQVVWPARLERIRGRELELLIDGAHNPAGARALAAHIEEVYARPLPMVVGIMADKASDAILAALARAASHLVCTAATTPRAMRPADLAEAAARVAPDRPSIAFDRPGDAIRHAARLGSPVVVAGSLYLVGEVRAEFS
jgi:dihydrofolate synthase/folylpolyglutamate synthase